MRKLRLIFYGNISEHKFTSYKASSVEGNVTGIEQWNYWCTVPKTDQDVLSQADNQKAMFGIEIGISYIDTDKSKAVLNFNRPLPFQTRRPLTLETNRTYEGVLTWGVFSSWDD